MPEFDSNEWCGLRDRKLMEWIGDASAVQFIIEFSDACELFDDLIDKDKPIEDGHVTRVLFSLLTELPLNPFFDKWKRQLIPVIVTGINAWLDANTLERRASGNDRVFAYVLRDWYMELVALVIYICRGRAHMRAVSLEVRKFFTHHETLEQYMAKLEAQT